MRYLSLSLALLLSATPARDDKPDLFILSIGVDSSIANVRQADWYAQDAVFMRRALVGADSLYETVHSRVLLGKEATRSQVMQGLSWIGKTAKKRDVAVVFFSTHASIHADGQYHIDLADSTLSAKDFHKALRAVKGRSLLLLDNCNSGALLEGIESRKKLAGIVACESSETSYGQWTRTDRPHGFFVLATYEALSGLADKDKDGIVTLGELQDYMPGRVTALDSRQHAVTLRDKKLDSIPLARLDPRHTSQPLWPPAEISSSSTK